MKKIYSINPRIFEILSENGIYPRNDESGFNWITDEEADRIPKIIDSSLKNDYIIGLL